MTEHWVTSADGTKINCEVHGAGQPLVIVSGALFSSKGWSALVGLLASTRSLYVLDRRGRGKSRDTPPYAPEREVEDLLAVLASIPGPLDLLGHSSGAILSLLVAMRAPHNLRRLAIYEPPVFFEAPDLIAPDLPERLDALLAAGQREAAVDTFFREGPRVTEAELSNMKAGPAWPHMVQKLAHTAPYDSRLQRSFAGSTSDLSQVRAPSLMLVGGASPARMRSAAQTIAERLPNARVSELHGQQHIAMLLAPAALAAALNEFLG